MPDTPDRPPIHLVHRPELGGYHFGPDHPMGPGRVDSALELSAALGLLDHLEVVAPPAADDALLRLVHDADYIEAVKQQRTRTLYGIGTTDNPATPGLHEVASAICTATVSAAEAVRTGAARAAINISGGLHHAMPSATSGFCVYNDAAIAIRWLREHGVQRVAYIDLDAHHGDGVQTICYDDPGVLTVSLHESPVHLFPGTGFATETGGRRAPGTAVNLALPPHTDDAMWLRAFDAVVPDVVRAFDPQIVISQHGCDAHVSDPLTDLELTVDGMVESYRRVRDLVAEVADGRWVAVGGGGYSRVLAVPRAWSHLIATVAGHDLAPATPVPASYRDHHEGAPVTMTDGLEVEFDRFVDGFDPASRLDQAIMATRRAVFPDLGLDPEL